MGIRTSCVILELGYYFFVVDNGSLPLLAQVLPGLTLVERNYDNETDNWWTYTLQNKQLKTSLEVVSGDQLLDYEEPEPETQEDDKGVILDASSETETDASSDEAPF